MKDRRSSTSALHIVSFRGPGEEWKSEPRHPLALQTREARAGILSLVEQQDAAEAAPFCLPPLPYPQGMDDRREVMRQIAVSSESELLARL